MIKTKYFFVKNKNISKHIKIFRCREEDFLRGHDDEDWLWEDEDLCENDEDFQWEYFQTDAAEAEDKEEIVVDEAVGAEVNTEL